MLIINELNDKRKLVCKFCVYSLGSIIILTLDADVCLSQGRSLPLPVIDSVIDKVEKIQSGESEDLLKKKQERYEELHSQLERLSKRWLEMKTKRSPLSSPETSGNTHQSSPKTSPMTNKVEQEQEPEIDNGFSPTDKSEVVKESATDYSGEVVSSTSATTQLDEAKLIREGSGSEKMVGSVPPVDRFALASSLFATGHYKECLHVLDSLEQTDWEAHEVHWAAYLKAGCYRKLGRSEESQQLYRQIVASEDAEWLASVSRWWLTHMQAESETKTELEQLSIALKQWEQEVDTFEQRSD